MIGTTEKKLTADCQPCGLLQGEEVFKITLASESLKVEITNLGASFMALYAPDRNQVQKNVVAGFEDVANYQTNSHYLGCILGRYANRIAGGKFMLDDNNINLSLNDGVNHLHGGFVGFNKRIWQITSLDCNERQAWVEFEYFSHDGEEGYPGNLQVKVKYILDDNRRLTIEYRAETDKATPVNLSNHSYFNLSGFKVPVVKDHVLSINAGSYTEKNVNNVPSGKILPVAGTALDFTKPKTIGADLDKFPVDKGFDHNFILNKQTPKEVCFAAQVNDPASGRILNVYTDQPGLQLYTANLWTGEIVGSHGAYQQHGALALETQAFPDSPNQQHFPNTILRAGEQYFSTTIYEFKAE